MSSRRLRHDRRLLFRIQWSGTPLQAEVAQQLQTALDDFPRGPLVVTTDPAHGPTLEWITDILGWDARRDPGRESSTWILYPGGTRRPDWALVYALLLTAFFTALVTAVVVGTLAAPR